MLSTGKTEDFKLILGSWKIPTADPATPRAPSLVEAGAAELVIRACQLVGGKGRTLEELNKAIITATKAPPPTPTPAPVSPPVRKLKMSAIASQVDDTEFNLLAESEMIKLYAEYERVFGTGERPQKDCEPTLEQVSAVAFDSNLPPFAIFKPFGHRMERKLKLSGMSIGRDGALRTIEVTGPPNIAAWLAWYNVLMTILVMKRAVDLGLLLRYRARMERLHDRYSDKVWAVLYQAEARCRLELMDRLRREAVAEHETVVKSGGASSFDVAKPWSTAWMRAVAQEDFWRAEVIEPGSSSHGVQASVTWWKEMQR